MIDFKCLNVITWVRLEDKESIISQSTVLRFQQLNSTGYSGIAGLPNLKVKQQKAIFFLLERPFFFYYLHYVKSIIALTVQLSQRIAWLWISSSITSIVFPNFKSGGVVSFHAFLCYAKEWWNNKYFAVCTHRWVSRNLSIWFYTTELPSVLFSKLWSVLLVHD